MLSFFATILKIIFPFLVQCNHDEHFCQGRCIESEKVCDGNVDCVDHSDEANCPTQAPECPEDQCADGSCIYQYQRCDGRRDCAGGEDESGCRKYLTQFTQNTKNILLNFCVMDTYSTKHFISTIPIFLTNISQKIFFTLTIFLFFSVV